MDTSSNMLRIIVTLFTLMLDLVISGNGDDVLTTCGNLSIETPTILGRNITFSFTPDTHDPNANLTWQRKNISETTWSTLNLTNRRTKYRDNNTFYLVLMDSVEQDGQQNYRGNYSYETKQCFTETKTLEFEDIPIIKFNISGSELNITEGKQVHVECLAGNNSASSISWIEEKSSGNVTIKNCSLVLNCVLSFDASFDANATSNRTFICSTTTDHKRLTVNILAQMSKENEKNRKKETNIEYIFKKLVVWIILGSCLLVTGIIITVVIFVVISKRRQNPKEKKECPENYRATVGKVRNQHNPVYDLQECQNEAEHSHEIADEEPAYSQPLKPRTRENKDNLYSNVNDARTSAQERHADSGKLFYADLDFDPNETPSKGDVFKRRDPSTEYADIDFPKTNTQKDIAHTIVEREKTDLESYKCPNK